MSDVDDVQYIIFAAINSSQTWQIGDASFTESDTYDSDDGSMASMTAAGGETLTYGYDTIKRLSTVTAKTASATTIYKQTFAYKTISGSQTSTQVSSLTYSSLDDTTSYTYIYDAYGRITRETDATAAYTGYSYDVLNQLRYATMYNSSGVADYRYKYFYDNSGNLVNWYINNNDNTETYENHTYTYGNTSWPDLLTAFDGYGIAYEGQTYNSTTNTVTGTAVSGNPISYYNGTRWTFGWSNGRQLTSASKTATSISYAYDLNGLRTSKTVGTKTYTYVYAGGKLLQQTDGTNTWNFAYAANGNPFSLTYNGTTYYYITNQMGDVMYLVNATGTRVAAYTYDPYGKVLTATGTMATVNPLRYRGYYYDTETGFYYLQSRYYDPAICRFINADGYASTGQSVVGYNMFSYCNNHPTGMRDISGNMAGKSNTVVMADRAAVPKCSGDPEAIEFIRRHQQENVLAFQNLFEDENVSNYYATIYTADIKTGATLSDAMGWIGALGFGLGFVQTPWGKVASIAIGILTTPGAGLFSLIHDDNDCPPDGFYTVIEIWGEIDSYKTNHSYGTTTTTIYNVRILYCTKYDSDGLYQCVYTQNRYITVDVWE